MKMNIANKVKNKSGISEISCYITTLVFILIFVCACLLTPRTLNAEIIEINHFEQLSTTLKNAPPEALIVFDVDEVLVYPQNIVQLQVAADFWESTMDNIEQRLGRERRNDLHAIMLLQSKWFLTDPKMPTLIQTLQAKKHKIVALTAFWTGKMGNIESVESWRINQLKNNGINLSVNPMLKQTYLQISNETFLKRTDRHLPVYQEGVIFTSRHPKGEVIKAFLKQLNYTPKEIIFIDDRIKNVKELADFCKAENIPYLGLHDKRLLLKFNTFNERLGKFQFERLEKDSVWLGDPEAIAMISKLQSGG